MRLTTLLFFFFSLSLNAHSGLGQKNSRLFMDCTGGGCVVNAGQDQVICSDGKMELQGEDGNDFASPLTVTWAADATNPTVLNIDQPDALTTTVSTGGGNYAPGTYTFTLTVTCADGTTSCSETTVTVVELPNIQLVLPETPECSNTIFLARSEALPEGATESLVFSPAMSVSAEEVPGGFLITRNPNAFQPCRTNFIYSVFAGNSCSLSQTGVINIFANTPTTSLTPRFVTCSDGIISGFLDIRDYNTVCGEVQLAVISTPPGVLPSEVTFSNNAGSTRYRFSAPAGAYTFDVTISSVCGVTTATTTVNCSDDGDGSCTRISVDRPSYSRQICTDFTEAGTVQLALPFFEDATYEITPSSDFPAWLSVNLTLNGAFTTVDFSGERPPTSFFNTTAFFNVRLFDNLNPDCPPVEFSTYVNVPRIFQVINDRINVNCGTGSIYTVSENIRITSSGRFNVISAPPGYTGITTGILGTDSDLLQLSQFGTYLVEYVDLAGGFDNLLNQGFRCLSRDTFAIVVDDIPNIDAGSDATVCEEQIQLNGSTPRNSAGIPVDINILWEPVEDYPGVVISDPTIRNPVVTGLVTSGSYTFRYSFPGDPNCEKEDLVTITVAKECDDGPPLTCDISLKSSCNTCGCGKPVFSVRLRNSNGDRFELGTYTVSWFIDGVPTQVGNNLSSISTHYDGPLVVTALVNFELADGTKCTIEESIAVTCGKDCPVVAFEYSTDDCFKDLFYGEVTLVDGAGHPLGEASIDWYTDGTFDENPYMVYSEPGEIVPVAVNFYWREGCSFKLGFEPDCFNGSGGSKRAATNGSADATYKEAAGVYPSPAGGHQAVTVNFGKYAPASLRVLDLNGREIFQTLLPAGSKDYVLSPNTLSTGVMIVVLRDEDGTVLTSQRFVVR